MTISVVQSLAIGGYSGNFGSAVTIGNSIVMAVTGRNPGNSITTSAPQYNGASVSGAVKLIDQNDTANLGGTYVSLWLLPDVASSGTSLSITTNSNNTTNCGIIAYEVAGLGASPALDQSSSSTGITTSTQQSGATGNITSAPEFVLGTVCQDNSLGASYPPAGWTSQNNGTANSVAGYQIQTSSGVSFNYNLGAGNANWTAAVATIATGAAAAPSGTVQPLATVPVPRRRPSRAVVQFIPVVTVNTGHGPAGRAQPLAASLIAPRRKPGRAVVHFIPVTTVNGPAPPPKPQHGTPSSDEARGFKRWLLWGA